MKLRAAFVFLLIVTTLLSGCGKDERIEGKVQDIFGDPLKGVTVKIQTSTFSSITDESGNYSLDYAPGSIKLIFSKDGYTTRNLDLNIQQKTYFPAETFELSPIPSENGIFYVDLEKKRLVKIEENGRIESYNAPRHSFDFDRQRYAVKFFKPLITIKPGKAMFIDRTPYKIIPTTVRENGVIYEGERGPMGEPMGSYSSGIFQDLNSPVGDEKLLIRLVELSSDTYAWIKPSLRETAFGFQVEDTAAKESKLPNDPISKSKEAQSLQQSTEIRTPVTGEPLKHPGQEVKVQTENQQTSQVALIPIHKQGNTYILESINLDSGTRNTTERKVTLANPGKIVIESKNSQSKSGRVRKLEFTPEWNLITVRNSDGSGVNYSPPLKYYEFPLTSGKTWQQTSIETNIKTGAIREHTLSAVVGDWENVTVAAGSFRGIKVTIQAELVDRTTGQKTTSTDTSWYVPEVRRSVRSLTSSRSPEGVESRQDLQLIRYNLIK